MDGVRKPRYAGVPLRLVVAGLSLNVAALWALIYQLVRQRGRLLLRLDELEQAVTAGGVDGTVARQVSAPVGSAFPSFALLDLDGKRVALEDFRGTRLLLVNWSFDCTFCDQVAPELAGLQDKLKRRNTDLALVADGDAEANRGFASEYGLRCPILLRSDREVVEGFESVGTPAAYLLDEQGQVLEPLALGAPDMAELARNAATRVGMRLRPVSDSRIVRDGLKPGTPAPMFTLPLVDGGTFSMEEWRGQRIVLVFTDPHCGPCDELMPKLAALYRRAASGRPALVLVGRGDHEENRRKVQAHGIEFPFAIQPRWHVSREYGIFSTPVGFVISEEGVIAREVAKGTDEIVTLLETEFASRREAPIGA